jgi:hypothetical protein
VRWVRAGRVRGHPRVPDPAARLAGHGRIALSRRLAAHRRTTADARIRVGVPARRRHAGARVTSQASATAAGEEDAPRHHHLSQPILPAHDTSARALSRGRYRRTRHRRSCRRPSRSGLGACPWSPWRSIARPRRWPCTPWPRRTQAPNDRTCTGPKRHSRTGWMRLGYRTRRTVCPPPAPSVAPDPASSCHVPPTQDE